MNHIVVFGGGRSSLFLIEYLSEYALTRGNKLIVCDRDISYAVSHARVASSCEFREADISDPERVSAIVSEAELVVSMLPAFLHMKLAGICLAQRKHLATASYISPEMKALGNEVKEAGLIFLNECGLDPGIDHMSALQVLDDLRNQGARITGFRSYCGGLVADEDDGDNPWRYKFSWNPRNVVLAAQGPPATYLERGRVGLKPYHRVFADPETFEIEGYGKLEAYPNRDSLHYIEMYRLEGTQDMIRGTFRKPGFCRAWQVLVLLGLTDDQSALEFGQGAGMTDWMATYLGGKTGAQEEEVKRLTGCTDTEIGMLRWLGFFTDHPLPLYKGSSAAILEELLKEKWKLGTSDRDLVVMLHEISYTLGNRKQILRASLVLKGESNTQTAMAKTVGLPLAIACRLILEGKIASRGVLAPVEKEIYEPVLKELQERGIDFRHEISDLS